MSNFFCQIRLWPIWPRGKYATGVWEQGIIVPRRGTIYLRRVTSYSQRGISFQSHRTPRGTCFFYGGEFFFKITRVGVREMKIIWERTLGMETQSGLLKRCVFHVGGQVFTAGTSLFHGGGQVHGGRFLRRFLKVGLCPFRATVPFQVFIIIVGGVWMSERTSLSHWVESFE